MLDPRRDLKSLETKKLRETTLEVRHEGGESRRYKLIRQVGAGEGKTAIAWQSRDALNRTWAIKFVLKEYHGTHSLQAEAERANKLRTGRFAPIDFYGLPTFEIDLDAAGAFYAIVIQWVDGTAIGKYLKHNRNQITVKHFLLLAKDFCAALGDLKDNGLAHNDLHGRNVLVVDEPDPITQVAAPRIVIIDTGQIKTENRRLELIEVWRKKSQDLESLASDTETAVAERRTLYQTWVDWFERSDQEWAVFHLCSIFNVLRSKAHGLDVTSRRFLQEVPKLLDAMIDPDASRRLTEPLQIFAQLENLWSNATNPVEPKMSSPFDMMSAELIRSNRQLMELFADEFPGLSECRSHDPVYVYGPRGSGKSTILRSLSLPAILESGRVTEELDKIPFCGVYVSCSSELRSRFWLLPKDDYKILEGHIVRYFSLLLTEALVETLEICHTWDKKDTQVLRFGVTASASAALSNSIHKRLFLGRDGTRASHGLDGLLIEIRAEREHLWGRILDRSETRFRTDAQLIFDVCEEVARICPTFEKRRIVFLLDDYSNQRIPGPLQRRLNQAITFSKQANPIFKVTSEYDGVDLEGIQEGREVREVNVGQKYASLEGVQRWGFLESILRKRFDYLETPVDLLGVFPLSGLGPTVPMARKIRKDFEAGRTFRYHGFDTISDLCSGDFATGLDLVRKIVEEGGYDWSSLPRPIPVEVQHKAVERFASRELHSVRYLAPQGARKYAIMDRLCWLARESVIGKDTVRGGETIPLIRTHIDISEATWLALQDDPGNFGLMTSITRKGFLFSIDTSKSREERDGTRRYQIRRILLPRYGAPLGRHTPIRIDSLETLRFLLTEPESFARSELGKATDKGQLDLP